MSEKIRGKRAATDEPAQKKRKTAAAAPLKLGDISLGGDQTTQTQRTAVFEWSDDDEISVAAPPSTKVPPRNTHVEEQAKRGEEVPEQWARGVPTQQAKGVPEQRARGVPGRQAEEVPEWQAEKRPTMETAGPPPQGAQVDPRAAPGGSGRQRRFKKLYRQAKP